jgi:Tfp pilus assembly protein PilF
MRQAAIDLRQESDDLYGSSPSQAEAKYKSAIQNDATYHVPYLRLADLYKSQGKADLAKDIVNEALKVDSITGTQRAELEAKLRSLG